MDICRSRWVLSLVYVWKMYNVLDEGTGMGEHSLLESFSLFLAPFEPRDSFSSFIEFWFHWALLSVRCTVGREAAYMLRIGHWMVG